SPERGAAPTLVVLAHHDAPQTGIVFDQTIQRRLHALAPELIERIRTSPPQWWIGLAGPLCTIAGSLARRRGLVRAGLLIGVVGSSHLMQLEAEGPVWMEEYEGRWLRDLLAACAERAGIRVRRGYRARASTDSVIPSRAGYPIATLASVCDWGPPANYHLPSDIPANLEYARVADA